MENIKGVNIKQLDFIPYELGDFLHHEGPLVVHYTDLETTHDYLFKWADHDEQLNRWLISRVEKKRLQLFLNKKITLKDLLVQPVNNFIYIMDADENFKAKKVIVTAIKDIPDKYFPSDKSWFDELHYEDYALELKDKLNQPEQEDMAIFDLIRKLPAQHLAQLKTDLQLMMNKTLLNKV